MIEVHGRESVQKMLRDYTNPKLAKRVQGVTKAGAEVFKAPLKVEARRRSRRLARSLSVRRAARERPATVVTFRPKVAWFRHFIIGGTADHGPRSAPALVFVPGWNPYSGGRSGQVGNAWVRALRVRGLQPDPMVERVVNRYESAAYSAIDRELDRTETRA